MILLAQAGQREGRQFVRVGVRVNRDGTRLPFRMAGYPYLTAAALGILALIFGLLLSEEHTRLQFLSMATLTAVITASSEIARRVRRSRVDC